jgi:hypothetical protein
MLVLGLHQPGVEARLITMKITLFALLILCSATVLGQVASVTSAQVQMITMAEHPEHASHHAMAEEKPLVGGSPNTYTYEHGERPLWDFGAVTEQVPLGDVARACRKEKLTAKKAEIVFEKQGS